ncbi:MAG: T9SS type A sorting domain-containing protein [Bacteroidota bacterium]
MKTLFTLLLLMGFGGCWGQFTSEKLIAGHEISDTRDLVMADLDQDGDSDVLVVSFADNTVGWYENYLDDNFSRIHIISNKLDGASAVRAADINNDGKKDVIAAVSNENKVIWFENDGNADFSEQYVVSEEIINAKTLFLSDLDKDGDIDILTVSLVNRNNTIIWLKNEGENRFSQHEIVATESNGVDKLHVGDLDNDGDMDILSTFSAKTVYYKNNGNNEFNEEYTVVENNYSVRSSSAEDIDGDGDLDIYPTSSRSGGGSGRWYENDGRGNFSNSGRLPTGSQDHHVLKMVDLDQDNDLDLITSEDGSRELNWYENDGQGNFSGFNLFNVETIPFTDDEFVSGITTADIDNDGTEDVIFMANNFKQVGWYENYGGNNFSDPRLISSQTSYPLYLAIGDIDGDADLDVIATSWFEGKIAWYRNEQDGFSEEIIVTKQTEFPNNVILKDINNDDQIDLLFASNGNEIVWYENIDGNFGQQHSISSDFTEPSKLMSIDFDNDGDNDILACSRIENSIVWFENTQSGNIFMKHIISASLEKPTDLLVFDFNEDGLLDVFCSFDDKRIAIMLNQGGNVFIEENTLGFSFIIADINSVDIDSDGDMDVLYASSRDDVIGWLENNGVGRFITRPISRDMDDVRNIEAIDFDNDGDVDILSNAYERKHTVLFLNDGEENFSTPIIVATHEGYNLNVNTIFADIDQDGNDDIISASFYEDKLVWYENIFDEPSIEGIVFWDINENKLFDSTEYVLKNISLTVEPNATFSYTDEEGRFRYYLSDGEYEVSISPNSCWILSTDTATYSVSVPSDFKYELNFGLKLTSDYQHTQARLISAATRCGFTVPFTLSVQNDGCVPSAGQYGLVLSDLVTLIEAAVEPIAVNGDTLFWNYEQLFSSEDERVDLMFEIAGTDFLGDTIRMKALSYIENDNGELALSSTYDYASEIRCAYDPNDKLVYPNRAGEYDKNYTLFEETFEYTVRFQNTGTDTAFTVVIKDYLDPNLDWKTFKPVLSSHPHETLLHSDGLVEFTFRNILLPDSTTNEPLSHGFVTFKIAPTEGLDENTAIENTADIFFDFNPPITTNTTNNVMVSELPKVTSVNNWELAESGVTVFPNPFDQTLTFQLVAPTEGRLLLFDATGRLLLAQTFSEDTLDIQLHNWANGLYFYQIWQADGELLGRGKIVKE